MLLLRYKQLRFIIDLLPFSDWPNPSFCNYFKSVGFFSTEKHVVANIHVGVIDLHRSNWNTCKLLIIHHYSFFTTLVRFYCWKLHMCNWLNYFFPRRRLREQWTFCTWRPRAKLWNEVAAQRWNGYVGHESLPVLRLSQNSSLSWSLCPFFDLTFRCVSFDCIQVLHTLSVEGNSIFLAGCVWEKSFTSFFFLVKEVDFIRIHMSEPLAFQYFKLERSVPSVYTNSILKAELKPWMQTFHRVRFKWKWS